VRTPSALLLLALLWLPAPARAAEPALPDLVERVAPAVVNIHTTGVVETGWWFGAPFGYHEWTSLGSGFVVDAEGLVITNHHVVQHASTIRVGLQDGRTFDASVVGVDPAADLALLSIEAHDLPAAELGSSGALRVGEAVFAVGNPFGYDHTVTAGILSARYRDLGIGPYDDFLQTDASINPGNSGGPLFDMRGRVIGVNTVIHAQGEGMGFAVPSDLLAAALPHLRQGGEIARGWPGMRVTGGEDGAAVTAVFAEAPAAAAGLQPGDLVVEAAGRPVRDEHSLTRALGSSFPGDTLTLRYVRDGKTRNAELALADHAAWAEEHVGPPLDVPALGIAVRSPAPDRAADLGLEPGQGVEVVEITGRLGGSFFRLGDVILEFGGQAVTEPMDMPPLADKAVERREIAALVMRGGHLSRVFYRW